VKYGSELGRDFTVDKLMKDGFKAVYIATGSHKSKLLEVPGALDGAGAGLVVVEADAVVRVGGGESLKSPFPALVEAPSGRRDVPSGAAPRELTTTRSKNNRIRRFIAIFPCLTFSFLHSLTCSHMFFPVSSKAST
jgi:hypothetical protein